MNRPTNLCAVFNLSTFVFVAAFHAYMQSAIKQLLASITTRTNFFRAWCTSCLFAAWTSPWFAKRTITTITRVTFYFALVKTTSESLVTHLKMCLEIKRNRNHNQNLKNYLITTPFQCVAVSLLDLIAAQAFLFTLLSAWRAIKRIMTREPTNMATTCKFQFTL